MAWRFALSKLATKDEPRGCDDMLPPSDTSFQLNDEQLLLAFRERSDRDCFELLVRRYEREIYTFLRRFLNDEQLAEDAFQATFLALFMRADQFEEGRRFRPWLYAIATNKAIDCQRRRKKGPSLQFGCRNRKSQLGWNGYSFGKPSR